MSAKNYYVILGIDESETARGIKDAFRERVKQYHPDRAGPQGTKQLQEVIEAYEHLSDPELRRQYNDTLRARVPPAPVQRPGPEPLIPEPAGMFSAREQMRPSSHALFDRIFGDFTETGVPAEEPHEAVDLELILSREEAAFGVDVPLRIPVLRPCPRCDGSGHDWLFPCRYCLGRGVLEGQRSMRVRVPPMVQNRSILEIDGESLGVRNLLLRLHLRIR